VGDLQTILKTALTRLHSFSLSNPNPFVSNFDPTTCQASRANGSLVGCGYQTFFAGANQAASNPAWSGLFDNPDVYYGSVYTGTKCFSSLADVKFPDDFSFKLRNDEAIVWLGCTPAAATYYSFHRGVVNLTSTQQTNGLLGESINDLSANTASNTSPPTKWGAATLFIYASDQDVVSAIKNAFVASGFPESAINVDPWPTAEVHLAQNGQFTSETSVLTLVNRIYKFASPNAAAYAGCASQFPFVRLTPTYPRSVFTPVSKLEKWNPEDQGFLYGSEWGFLPVLQGVVKTVSSYTSSVLGAGGWKLSNSFVSQPFRYRENGLRWILESRFGAFGTKDASYNIFPIQLSQAYAFNPVATGPTNPALFAFSAVCGLDQTAQFTTNVPQLSHIPTATYTNFALYGLNPANGGSAVGKDSGLAGYITNFVPLNISAFPPAVQGAFTQQIFNKVGVPTASQFYCNYFSNNCAALHAALPALPCAQVDTTIPFGNQTLGHVFRAYLNPFTRTAPSEVTLLPPFLTTFTFTK
jgi:hypothetical protein